VCSFANRCVILADNRVNNFPSPAQKLNKRRTAANSLLLKTGAKNTAGLVIYAIRHQVFSLEQF
jgi:hypothetical protein